MATEAQPESAFEKFYGAVATALKPLRDEGKLLVEFSNKDGVRKIYIGAPTTVKVAGTDGKDTEIVTVGYPHVVLSDATSGDKKACRIEQFSEDTKARIDKPAWIFEDNVPVPSYAMVVSYDAPIDKIVPEIVALAFCVKVKVCARCLTTISSS
jgi:hypothetical protein